MASPIAPSMAIPYGGRRVVRECRDGEVECIVCRRPIKASTHKLWIWVHLGGGHVVTTEEGERLNTTEDVAGDLGAQPVGAGCVQRYPQLKPYLIEGSE